jgi:hypothetical protein
MLSASNISETICNSLYKDSRSIHPLYYKHTGTGNWFSKEMDYIPLPSFDHGIFPDQLQIEYAAKKSIQAEYVLTSKRHNGVPYILTGLRPSVFNDWYYGDIPGFKGEELIKSLVLLEFSPDCTRFRVYFSEGFFPMGKTTDRKINDIVRMHISTRMKF